MQVSYDTEACATYITVTGEDVARTVDVTDLISVDLDAAGEPVGVEFLVLPHNISDEMIEAVVARFHTLDWLTKGESWRPAFA